MVEMLGVPEMAKLLGITEQGLRNRLSRRPDSLPPPVRVPGGWIVRWRVSTVEAWMAQAEEHQRRGGRRMR